MGFSSLPPAATSLGTDLAERVLSCAAMAVWTPQLPSDLVGPGSVTKWPAGKASPQCSVTAGCQPQ